MYYNSNLYEADSYLVIIIECFCEEWTNTWNWLRGELVAEYKGRTEPIQINFINLRMERVMTGPPTWAAVALRKNEANNKANWWASMQLRSNWRALRNNNSIFHQHQSTTNSTQTKKVWFCWLVCWIGWVDWKKRVVLLRLYFISLHSFTQFDFMALNEIKWWMKRRNSMFYLLIEEEGRNGLGSPLAPLRPAAVIWRCTPTNHSFH